MRRYLSPDLRTDPAYAIDFDTWRTWRESRKDPRRRADFLGDRDFPFDHPPTPRRPTRQAPEPAHDDEDCSDALAYHNEEAKYDSYDYVTCIF
jgi:hypothetical protein